MRADGDVTIVPGAWYVDVSPGAADGLRFRVLDVGADIVLVEDDRGGGSRVVNKLMFETQMARCDAPPKQAGAKRSN